MGVPSRWSWHLGLPGFRQIDGDDKCDGRRLVSILRYRRHFGHMRMERARRMAQRSFSGLIADAGMNDDRAVCNGTPFPRFVYHQPVAVLLAAISRQPGWKPAMARYQPQRQLTDKL